VIGTTGTIETFGTIATVFSALMSDMPSTTMEKMTVLLGRIVSP
jgi:hypothetical protein